MKVTPDFFNMLSEYVKILIPSIITYFVTRYSLMRPRKYEIKDKQFNLVYLPLYLLTNQYLSQNNNLDCLDIYFRKVDKIIYKNYQYVFPKTIKLLDTFKTEWKKNNRNFYHMNIFQNQILSDYEKLKRELGYPSNSIIDFFRRLNSLDKKLYIIYGILFLLALFFVLSIYISLIQKQWLNSAYMLFPLLVCIFCIYIINYPSRH